MKKVISLMVFLMLVLVGCGTNQDKEEVKVPKAKKEELLAIIEGYAIASFNGDYEKMLDYTLQDTELHKYNKEMLESVQEPLGFGEEYSVTFEDVALNQRNEKVTLSVIESHLAEEGPAQINAKVESEYIFIWDGEDFKIKEFTKEVK